MAKKKSVTKKNRKEVCIYGYAEETRDLVFELPPEVEIWGINMAHMFLKNKVTATRWLQIHPRDWSSQGQKPTGYWGRPKAHLTFLKKFKGKVIMSYDDPDIPNCHVYEFGRYRAKFGREYYRSSFAYLMAMAIAEGYDKIYLYGINLTALDEYTHQRPNMEYWMGRAEQAGIQLVIPEASALLKAPSMYGLKVTDGDLSTHAGDRLATARGSFIQSAYNQNTAMSMMLELQHWDEFLGSLMQLIVPEIEQVKDLTEAQQKVLTALGKKTRDTIAARFEKRRSAFMKLKDQAVNEMATAQGRVQSEQHYLSLLGGVDYRAGALPEVFYPNPNLKDDFDPPEKRAV